MDPKRTLLEVVGGSNSSSHRINVYNVICTQSRNGRNSVCQDHEQLRSSCSHHPKYILQGHTKQVSPAKGRGTLSFAGRKVEVGRNMSDFLSPKGKPLPLLEVRDEVFNRWGSPQTFQTHSVGGHQRIKFVLISISFSGAPRLVRIDSRKIIRLHKRRLVLRDRTWCLLHSTRSSLAILSIV